MQQVSILGLPNGGGWRVVQDKENQLYYLENDKRQRQFTAFTNRRMAEKALYDYLMDMVRTAPANLKKKNVNKEIAA